MSGYYDADLRQERMTGKSISGDLMMCAWWMR